LNGIRTSPAGLKLTPHSPFKTRHRQRTTYPLLCARCRTISTGTVVLFWLLMVPSRS